VAVNLAFLSTLDAAEANKFGMVWMQKFDGVAAEDANDGASQLSCKNRTRKQERDEDGPEAAHGLHASRGL